MIRDRQGRTECQTLALLYLVSSAARSALLLSGSKLICANTSTDASSSYSKDYYYYYYIWRVLFWLIQGTPRNSHNKVLAKIKHSTVLLSKELTYYVQVMPWLKRQIGQIPLCWKFCSFDYCKSTNFGVLLGYSWRIACFR